MVWIESDNLLSEEVIDHVIWEETNKGRYKISIVARLAAPNVYSVAYMIRLENREKQVIDFMLTLDGFKKLGELCMALHEFSKDPILVNERNVDTLKELLTSDNIKNYAKISVLKRK